MADDPNEKSNPEEPVNTGAGGAYAGVVQFSDTASTRVEAALSGSRAAVIAGAEAMDPTTAERALRALQAELT